MTLLRDKLQHLPLEPGVYVMKDVNGRIIYVGKAKLLKNRVSSYFRTKPHENSRIQALVARIDDFSVFVVRQEHEALMLERSLIRQHRPLYNVLFTDDKEYPLLRVSTQEDWPRFSIARRRRNDGATYLGPFGSSLALQQLLKVIFKIFPLVRCSAREFAQAKRPCNYYAMKQCLAPCTLPVEKALYGTMVQQAIEVLHGKNQEVRQVLRRSMEAASAELRYEEALILRNQLQAMDGARAAEQVVLDNHLGDCDLFGLAANASTLSLCLLKIRASRLVENSPFVVAMPLGEVDEALFEFLLQYYGEQPLPREIILSREPAFVEELREFFTPQHKLSLALRGKKKALLNIASRNAELSLAEAEREELKKQQRLSELQQFLNLPSLPAVIECLDISHHQGSATVASIVCFREGLPSKKDYRHYTLSEAITGPDDFASISEIMRRRLQKANEGRAPMPDLMVIDGGKGQLSAAEKARAGFPELRFSLVALAKSRLRNNSGPLVRSPERVFVGDTGEALSLREGSESFRLLTHLRNEAHRFALSFHRKKQGKITSSLDQLKGVGRVLRQRILAHFPSQEALRQASPAELSQIKGVSAPLAQEIHGYFQRQL